MLLDTNRWVDTCCLMFYTVLYCGSCSCFYVGMSACLSWDGGHFTELDDFHWVVSLRGVTLGNLGYGKGLIVPAELCPALLFR